MDRGTLRRTIALAAQAAVLGAVQSACTQPSPSEDNVRAFATSADSGWPQRVVITNDNGIDDEKMRLLAQAFAQVSETYIVAPMRDRSGTTLRSPRRMATDLSLVVQMKLVTDIRTGDAADPPDNG